LIDWRLKSAPSEDWAFLIDLFNLAQERELLKPLQLPLVCTYEPESGGGPESALMKMKASESLRRTMNKKCNLSRAEKMQGIFVQGPELADKAASHAATGVSTNASKAVNRNV
jgi:hypothetical protein